MTRLDKILSRELNITRSEAKALIKRGDCAVNGIVAKSGDQKCADSDEITVNGKPISNNEFVYIMLNKPKGVISASEGRDEKTVVDILPDDMKRRGLFPAGRLDKDTTGFALITDDGEFAHDILSPKKHVDKTYIAKLDKPFNDEVISDFKSGMTLNGEDLIEAELEPIDNDFTLAKVVLRQGLYHQVKRMFKKHGITVLELHRTAIGGLKLDETLEFGECRFITKDELDTIRTK